MRKPIYQLSVLSFVIFCCFLLPSCTGKKTNSEKGGIYQAFVNNDTLYARKVYVNNYLYRQKHIGRGIDPIHDHRAVQDHDARYCWFSLADLEKYIDAIKKEHADGIRFYYAVYSKVTEYPNDSVDAGYLNHHTLVLVATKDSAVPPRFTDSIECDLKTVQRINGHRIETFYTFGYNTLNHGQLCPPPTDGCSGATFMNESFSFIK